MRRNRHIKVQSFISRPSLFRFVVMIVALLAWGSPAFCGEIHDAAERGDARSVRALLEGSPDLVFSKDNGGDTPLQWAALNGRKDVAELLLDHKAWVDAKNDRGDRPLHWAALNGHRGVAELLLAHKADVNAKTKAGETPLSVAERNNHGDVAELLRQHGAQGVSLMHREKAQVAILSRFVVLCPPSTPSYPPCRFSSWEGLQQTRFFQAAVAGMLPPP